MARRRKTAERERAAPKSPKDWGAKCDVCPLRGSTPVYGDGPASPKIAVVGDAPGKFDIDAGVPFTGRAGEFIEDRLALHKATRRDVLLEFAVACFPPGGDMKGFLQRAKKDFRESAKGQAVKVDSDGIRIAAPTFQSPIDCCRPRLMYSLGVPRCAQCLKWDLPGPGISPLIACSCVGSGRWVKPKFPRVKGALVAGNAALEGLTGEDGVKAKMNYRLGKLK